MNNEIQYNPEIISTIERWVQSWENLSNREIVRFRGQKMSPEQMLQEVREKN